LESTGELVFEGRKVRVILQRIMDSRLDSAKSQVLATPALKATFERAFNFISQFIDEQKLYEQKGRNENESRSIAVASSGGRNPNPNKGGRGGGGGRGGRGGRGGSNNSSKNTGKKRKGNKVKTQVAVIILQLNGTHFRLMKEDKFVPFVKPGMLGEEYKPFILS
jgi:hypothetical protein